MIFIYINSFEKNEQEFDGFETQSGGFLTLFVNYVNFQYYNFCHFPKTEKTSEYTIYAIY